MNKQTETKWATKTMGKTNFSSIMTMRWAKLSRVDLSVERWCDLRSHQEKIYTPTTHTSWRLTSPQHTLQPSYDLFIMNCAKCTHFAWPLLLLLLLQITTRIDARSTSNDLIPFPIDEVNAIVFVEPDIIMQRDQVNHHYGLLKRIKCWTILERRLNATIPM